MSKRFSTRVNVDDFCTVNRRTLLRGLGTAALLTATGGLFKGGVWASPVFAATPFALGVASGDPAPDGFVLWTKIAPRPFERGGGMPRKAVEVTWIVATDIGDTQERWLYDGFRNTRARWTVLGQQVMVMRCDRDPDP